MKSKKLIIDCHNHLGVELRAYLRGDFPYTQDLPTLAGVAKQEGIDRCVVFPFVTHFAQNLGGLRDGIIHHDGTLETVPYAFENRRMLEEIYYLFPALAPLAIPFVIVDPLHETAAQSKVLRELREQYPFYGLKMQTTMIESPVLSLLKEGRCFLDLAREWNIPFLIHSSVYVGDKWAQAKDILTVAEANPDIRFCLAHSCRFDRECLDRVAALSNTWFDCSAHSIHCKGVEANMFFVASAERRFKSDYSNPAGVLRHLAETYPSKLMWGSDSPYQSFVSKLDNTRLITIYQEEIGILKTLPQNLLEKIAHDNILEFLQLPSDYFPA